MSALDHETDRAARALKLAKTAREVVDLGRPAGVVYEPGDMTRYDLVIAPLAETVALDDAGLGRSPLHGWGDDQVVLVSLANIRGGAFYLRLDGPAGSDDGELLHFSYVGEKMDLPLESAVNVAAFLAMLAGRPAAAPIGGARQLADDEQDAYRRGGRR